MILVDTALARRQAEGRPIRVGIVGAGFQGAAIVRQIVTATPGMEVVALANRHVGKAIEAFTVLGITPQVCDSRRAIEAAIARKPKGHDFIIDRRHNRPSVGRHMSVTGG